MSWVFLTERHAYKLKKPVRTRYVDFSTEAARHQNCIEEVHLNQRLSSDVYLGTVPLTRDAGGQLRLGQGGEVVDWLVKMRRLPGERMLDHAIHNGAVRREDIYVVMEALCRVYRASPSVAMPVAEYWEGFAEAIAANHQELTLPHYALPIELIEAVCARQRTFLDRQTTLFDERLHAGRIVEGHGDLRPEHICLESPPQIIDCLEFSRALRTLDTADELAFLALECERLGAPELKRHVFDAYSALTGDAPPSILVHFYQSYRACVRAKIAIWHMNEPSLRNLPKWPALARNYLRLAREHIEQCT
jgi:aminoglycoside phosphotransferase family enzyme